MPARTGPPPLTRVGGPVLVGLLLTACSAGAEGPAGTASPETSAEPTTEVTAAPPDATATPTTDVTAAPPGATATPTTGHDELTLAFVGDVMLGRSIGERILAGQDPFVGVAEELADADLVVGTLETTVGVGGQPEDKTFTFQAPPEAVDSLLAGGFDLVALANNHSYDYGADGLLATLNLLDDAGLEHVGAGADADRARAPVTLTADGVEVAFLSYVDVPDDWTGYRNRDWAATADTPGVAWADPDHIATDVAAARDRADHVVVLLHAGAEGTQEPTEVQRAAADAALAAGATAVVGAHPHVLQGHRLEDGALTAWSLGNFVFDGFGDEPVASQSAILNLTLDDDSITDLTWTPVAVVDGLPVALDPDSPEGREILDHLDTLPG